MRKVLAIILIKVLLFQNLAWANSDLILPASDEDQNMMTSHRDIPVININNPDDNSMSFNKFERFNTDERGAIVNNSPKDLDLKELGKLDYNPKLDRSADVIWMEVVGREPTDMKGDVVIASENKPELVISNQNGITCRDCKVINARHTTLTTKDHYTESNGNRGDVLIENMLTQGNLTLKGDKVTVNGDNSILGKLEIKATGNKVSAEDFAVDGSGLKSMYANQISIHSFGENQGVNMPDVSIILDSESDNKKLSVNSTGPINMARAILQIDKGEFESLKSVDLERAEIFKEKVGYLDEETNNLVMFSEKNDNIEIEAKEEVNLYGADINTKNLDINSLTGTVNTERSYLTADTLNIRAREVNNTYGSYLADKIYVNTNRFINNFGTINVYEYGEFSANEFLNSFGRVFGENILFKDVANFSNNYGEVIGLKTLQFSNVGKLSNIAGRIHGNYVLIDGKEVLNSNDEKGLIGEIKANRLFVEVKDLKNAGRIIGLDVEGEGNNIAEITTSSFNNSGEIYDLNELNIQAKEFVNSATGLIHDIGKAFINTKKYQNDGKIKATRELTIGDYRINCNEENLCNYVTNEDADIDFNIKNEEVGTGGKFKIFAKSFNNTINRVVGSALAIFLSGNTFINTANLQVNGDFVVNDPTGEFRNTGKIFVNGGDFIVNALKFTSQKTYGYNEPYYYNGGSIWYYDIVALSDGMGNGGNVLINSQTTADFIGATRIHADKNQAGTQIQISAQDDLSFNKNYYNSGHGENRVLLEANGQVNLSSNKNIYGNSFHFKSHNDDVSIIAQEKVNLTTAAQEGIIDEAIIEARNGLLSIKSANDSVELMGVKGYAKNFEGYAKNDYWLRAFSQQKHGGYPNERTWVSSDIEASENIVIQADDGRFYLHGSRLKADGPSPSVEIFANNGIELQLVEGGYTYNINKDWYNRKYFKSAEISALNDAALHTAYNNIEMWASSIESKQGKVGLYAQNGSVILDGKVITEHFSENKKSGKIFGKSKTHEWNTNLILPTEVYAYGDIEVDSPNLELTGAGLYSTTGVLRMPNNSNISLFPLLYTEYDYVKIKSSGLAASGVAGYFADKALGIDEVSGRTNILHISSLVRTIDDALKERGLFNVGARTALIYEILNPLSEFSKAYKANGGDIGKALEGVVLNQFGFDYNESLGAIVPAGIGGKKISYSREVINEQAYSSSINMPIIGNINNFTTSAAVLNISNSVLNINNYRNIPLTLRSTKKENTKSQTVMLSTNLKGGSIGGSKSSTVLEDERVMYTFLNGDNMTITIDTLTGEALQINGNDNTIVANNAVWKSFTDAHKYATKSKSGSMAFSVINGTPLATGGSFSKGHGYEESLIVNNVAGIFGDNNTYNSNTTHMEGAIMAGANLSANPGILTHADVEQYYKSEQKRIGVSAGGGLYAPVLNGHNIIHDISSAAKWVVNGLFNKNVDFKIAEEIRKGTLHATITDPTLVGAINTDINASQEWETIKKKEYSATIPLDMLTQSGREEIKQNLEEIGEVYKDISKRFERDGSKNEELKKAFDEAMELGLEREQTEFVLERIAELEEEYKEGQLEEIREQEEKKEQLAANNNEPPKPNVPNDSGKVEEVLEPQKTSRVVRDNLKLLAEVFEGEENVPQEFKDKAYEGKYYVREGSLGYEEGFNSKSHKILVSAADKAGKILEIAGEFQEEYGKGFEWALNALTAATSGLKKASTELVKEYIGEEALGEYIAKGIDYSLEKVSTAIRAADPYLSSESARNLAAVAIFAAMTSSGAYAETKGLKYALSKKTNNSVGSIEQQISNINYNKNNSGTGGTTKNTNNQNNGSDIAHISSNYNNTINHAKGYLINIDDKQLQKKFKHADKIGFKENWSKENGEKYKQILFNHVYNNSNVKKINGTYKKDNVIHYFDDSTGVNVITKPSGEFISAWKIEIGSDQYINLKTRGSL